MTSSSISDTRRESRDRLAQIVRDSHDALCEWVELRRKQLRVAGVQVCVRLGSEVLIS